MPPNPSLPDVSALHSRSFPPASLSFRPYGGLPSELWSWIMHIANSWSNGGEPHPERYESLLDFIKFMDTFHGKQTASPEMQACCLVSKRFYGIATKYLYRDVSLHSLERYRAYLKLLREDARLPPNERRGFGRFLVSLDLKTDAYLKDPSPIDIFHTPGHEPASDLTFARSDESPLLQASETVADLLLHTPNISVLLVEDEQNTRPEFFKTIELRASDIHLACWYHIEVTDDNLCAFISAFTALAPNLQELGFETTSSVLSPRHFFSHTFPSLTLPKVHSLRLRSPMTGGNGSTLQLLTQWNLPSLKVLHLDPHDEAGREEQALFLPPFLLKFSETVVDFFYDSSYFEDFIAFAHLLPNLTSLSAYLFEVSTDVDIEPLREMLAGLTSLLAYSTKGYDGYEAEELKQEIEDEVRRAERVTRVVDRKWLPKLEELLWVGGKSADRGGDHIQAWVDRLVADGVRYRPAIVDKEEPVPGFHEPLEKETSPFLPLADGYSPSMET